MLEVPAPLGDVSRYSKPHYGIEAVAFHPELGVVAAPMRPLKERSEDRHEIFSTSGVTLALAPHPQGNGKLKAIEVLPDGRLMVLDRLPRQLGDQRTAALRLVDPRRCDQGGQCTVAELGTSSQKLPDANFEGLAAIGNEMWLAVSDDTDGEQRKSQFVLFKLTLEGAMKD